MATFYNQATLSYSGGEVNSNIVSGELLEALSATKTAVVNEYSDNTDVTYAINIINSGASAVNGLTITDNLGAYTFGGNTLQPVDYVDGSVKYFVNGILQASPAVVAGPPLVISGINVPAGGVVTVLYTANTNEYAPLAADGTIENSAVVSGNGITDITVNETITAQTGPDLSITKSVSPAVVSGTGELTYTFVIENSGNTEATVADNIVVTDTFDPILSNIAVTYNGAVWSEPVNYTYNEATGLFQTVGGQITVPAASYTQDATTGEWVVVPGTVVLTVTGTV